MAITHEDIAEFLALAKSPVQLVKHFDEVPDSKKKFPMWVQLKKDGVYCLVVQIDGVARLYSRTGNEFYTRTADFVSDQTECLHDGVYITELCNPAFSLEEFSGMVSTNRKKAWDLADEFLMNSTELWFHDYINLDDLLNGRCELTYEQRYNELVDRLDGTDNLKYVSICYMAHNADDVNKYADEFIDEGEEGIVAKQPDCPWVAGHKGFHAMKLVRAKHCDLRCVGVEYGKGKRAGQIAKLQFNYFGNTFYADLGKGWTDERRADLTRKYEGWKVYGAKDDYSTPVGEVWEVYSLQESSTGKALRLPKAWRCRWDKDVADDEVDELIK